MYIFLDVDGVLNTRDDWKKKMYSLNPRCISVFNNLLNKIDYPKIVLSSTWRNGITRDGSRAAHIDDLMHALWQSGILEIDKTATSPNGIRSEEIDFYLKRHNSDNYIILDDDPDLFEQKEKTPHLYLTNPDTGIVEGDIRKILRMIR